MVKAKVHNVILIMSGGIGLLYSADRRRSMYEGREEDRHLDHQNQQVRQV